MKTTKEAKTKTSERRVYHFNVNGENTNRMIDNLVDEGRIKLAMDMTDSCGVPAEKILDVVLRKAVIRGNSRDESLCLVEYNETEHKEELEKQKIWFDIWLDRMCKKYAINTVEMALLQERVYYTTLLSDINGIKYRNPEKFNHRYGSTAGDPNREENMEQQKKIAENIIDLYPLITTILSHTGNDIILLQKYEDMAIDHFKEDFDKLEKVKTSPNLITNMGRDLANNKYKPVKEFQVLTHSASGEEYEPPKKIGSLDDVVGLPTVETSKEIVPFGIDLDYIESGWVSPDGLFYGRYGSIVDFIHKDVADDLQKAGIVPADHNNPDEWLEKDGWMKISQGRILFDNPKLDITNKQRNCLKAYAKHRNLPYIEIGMSRHKYSVDKIDDLSAIDLMR